VIDSFTGKYRFLSNFHPATVVLDGVFYRSVENAYQAAKTLDPRKRVKFEDCSPGEAKRYGRALTLRDDWDDTLKLAVMYELIRQKFAVGSLLSDKLLATGTEELVEGNYWGDTFWGVCKGQGTNYLGKILMAQREWLKGTM
jgi:ribA/ribD-fused uncharacterized protein